MSGDSRRIEDIIDKNTERNSAYDDAIEDEYAKREDSA